MIYLFDFSFKNVFSRLMTKLKTEQEARSQLENRLEDALDRLYKKPKASGSFFSNLFSKQDDMMSPNQIGGNFLDFYVCIMINYQKQ